MTTVSELVRDLQQVRNQDATVRIGGGGITAAGDYTGGTPDEDQFTAAAHGFAEDTPVVLLYKAAAGVLTGVPPGDIVYVVTVATNTFQLALTAGGSAIENTADGDIAIRAANGGTVDDSGVGQFTPAGEGPRNPNASPSAGTVLVT